MIDQFLQLWSSTVEPVMSIAEVAMSAGRFARNRVRRARAAEHWLPRLNEHLSNDGVRIRRLLYEEPRIEIIGPLPLSDKAKLLADQHRARLSQNDAVATFVETPSWTENPVELRARSTDYAAVCALDDLGRRPPILSGNALLYCADTHELILHRRSRASSRDHGDLLHTFGGAFLSPGDGRRPDDHGSLIRAARRETKEEAELVFDIAVLPPMLLTEELRIGFVQLALLGVAISAGALKTALDNYEGKISRVKLDDLPKKIRESDWVPTGRAHVLAWLALGAPVGTRRLRFGRATGQELFNEIVPDATEKP